MAVNVKSYGAKGDGTTNDTAFIQAAETAARSQGTNLYFPPGTYRVTSTLTYGVPGQQSYHSWVGEGPLATRLRWEGPRTGDGAVMVRSEGMFYGHMSDIGFYDPSGASGSEVVGLWVANTAGPLNGTGSTGNIYTHLHFDGLANGFVAGDANTGRAASELALHHCLAQNCTIGFAFHASNTLDIDLYGLQIAFCDVGLSVGQCGNLHIHGGSASYNRVDFYFGTAGTFSVNGFRSEVCSENCIVVSGPGRGPCKVSIRNCNMQAILTGGGDYGAGTGGTGGGCGIWLYGGAEVTIDSCHIEGWVGVSNYYSRPKLSLFNTTVRPLPGQTGPFAFYWGTDFAQYGDRYLNGMRYDVRGCSLMEQSSPFWPPVGPDAPEVFYPDPAAFFTDATGAVPDSPLTRDVPAPWDS